MSSLPDRTKVLDQTPSSSVEAAQHSSTDNIPAIYARYPLDIQTDQIRLLTVRPNAWDHKIDCTLEVVPLAKKPPYRALSYVWGPSEPQNVIYIDNQEVSVLPNLFMALRRLRAHNLSESSVIRTDAVCINQSSVIERSSLVGMMGKIYSQCMEVIVWLGELEDVSEKCRQFIASSHNSAHVDDAHPAGCNCKDDTWEASFNLAHTMAPSDMAVIAVPSLMRLAKAEQYEDLQTCRLFETVDEMIALRYFMSKMIGENPGSSESGFCRRFYWHRQQQYTSAQSRFPSTYSISLQDP